MNNEIKTPLSGKIKAKLKAYKQKFYIRELINGVILFCSILLIAFLSISILEYFGNFDTTARKTLFFGFVGIGLFAIIKHLIIPTKKLLNNNQELSDEQASQEIGSFFPEIKDKLLNTLQLSNLNFSENALVTASINQKTADLQHYTFKEAITFDQSKKFLIYYLALPVLLIIGLLIFNKETITTSTNRVFNYNEEYIPEAPFKFKIQNREMSTFVGENLDINLEMVGESIPENVYLVTQNGRYLMNLSKNTSFKHTFYNIQNEINFWFESSGFNSTNHLIKVKQRPNLQTVNLEVIYPKYLNKKTEIKENIGNLTIPEGTKLNWTIKSEETKEISFLFKNKVNHKALRENKNTFRFKKQIRNNDKYTIELKNEHGKNKDEISYNIDVIKDKFPGIKLENYSDTILYSYILVGGNISDDYGIRNLKLFYKKIKEGHTNKTNYKSFDLPFNRNQTNQNFVYQLNLDTFNLQPGEHLDYYVKIWDNDGINGSKSTKSKAMSFELPTKKEIDKKQDLQSEANKNELSDAITKSEKLNAELKKMSEQMKTKREMTWQDKKDMEKLLQKHRQLQSEMKELNEEMKLSTEQQKRFEKQSPELEEKMKLLQELMKNMIDPETQKLMDELEKLMEDEKSVDEINKKLDEINNKEDSFEKELDRALEMYKQLEFEEKKEEPIEELEELSQKQEELQKETEYAKSKEELNSIKEEQEKLNEEFKDITEKLDQLEDLNKELENKKDLDMLEQDQQDIEQNMENSSDQLEKNKKSNASKSQQNAAEKMKKMAEKMAEMKESAEMEQLEENIEDLKNIMDNLIKLSFNQENVINKLSSVSNKNPLFVEYSQKQLNIEQDAKIIEDSLYALAKRVIQIEAVVTKEVGQLKNYLYQSSDLVKKRIVRKAVVKQQYAMTSMNNLALLLDDILDNLQSEMGSKSEGNQMCDKPGSGKKGKSGKKPKPGMGDMQKQLNEMIQQLKNGQKQGKKMGGEMAKMAARQEMLRRGLQELQKNNGKKEGEQDGSNGMNDHLKKLEKAMKETEEDLLNGNITQQTINRQQNILTRLLEAENATRERDYNNERKATQASEFKRETPPNYDKYLKMKEKQVELLQTIPPNLNPYYKKEVNEYFNTISK